MLYSKGSKLAAGLMLATLAAASPAQTPVGTAAEAAPLLIDSAEALAIDAKFYATEFNVSFEEAVKRLTTMIYGTEASAQAAAAEGQDLAGRFFDNRTSDFGLVVVTKKSAAAQRSLTFTPRTKENYGRLNAESRRARNAERQEARRQARLSDAEVTVAEDALSKSHSLKVKYKTGSSSSLLDLAQAVQTISQQSGLIPGFQIAFVDETTSTVRVLVKVQLSEAQLQAARNLVKVPVEFEYTPTGVVPVANMRGGSKLYWDSTATSATSRACMTAFGARSATYGSGMVTAAHCQGTQNVIADDGRNYTLSTGAVSDSRGGYNEADIKFVYAPGGNPIGLGTFYYDGTTNVRSVAGTQSRGATAVGSGTWNQVTGTAVGSYICHLGQTSYGSTSSVQSCGEVISVNASQGSGGTSASQYGGSFVMVRNTQSGKGTVTTTGSTGTLRCYQGDSGGPWFAGTIAYGVMSACAWADTINGNQVAYSIYTSTDFFNQLGVSIIVP